MSETKATREEIAELKNKLNAINEEKEKFFSEKSEISKKIAQLIGDVKDSRSQRNEKTSKVSELKDSRKKLNAEIKDKIVKIKELNDKKTEILKKHSIQQDPVKLKREIEQLEFTIETTPMGIEKEQRFMKQLKSLKASYAKVGEVSGVFSESNTLSKDIDKLKKEADNIHKQIQNDAGTSQKRHESMIGISKDIDDLKKQEKELHDKFMEKKQEFNEINIKLKDLLKDSSDKGEKVRAVKKKAAAKKKDEFKKDLAEKSREVSDKVKKGKKLTTEDLLLFQAVGNDKDLIKYPTKEKKVEVKTEAVEDAKAEEAEEVVEEDK